MDDASIFVSAFVALVAYLAIWVGWASLKPVAGVWHRESDGVEEEYIQIEQFGPFITAKRNVDGGNQMYTGLQTFNRVRLVRRDYGIPALIQAGFPAAIAKKINGTVMAKLSVKRRSDKLLDGEFRPQKVLFDEASAQVLSRQYQGAIARAYHKTDLEELPSLKSSGPRHANLPKPDPAPTKKKRNTF
jgi:hypothetical protein